MRILSLDAKKGFAKLIPDNLDDLWVLSEILKEGDTVGMRSLRKVKLSLGERQEAEKKPMFLKIAVIDTKFQEYSSSLRITGKITEGPEDIRGTHTFSVDFGSTVEVWKDFSSLETELLRDSQKKRQDVAFVLVDREDALVSHGSSRVWIRSGIASKDSGGDDDYANFFGQIKARLREINPEYVVVAGPGFVKDKLSDEISFRHVVEGASSVSESGIREVIARGALEKVGAEIREAEEQKAVDEVFSCIHSGKAFYGMEEAVRLCEQGNILSLVVSSSLIAGSVKKKTYPALRSVIEKIKYAGGKTILVGRNEDALSRLDGLGGIAGIKRW